MKGITFGVKKLLQQEEGDDSGGNKHNFATSYGGTRAGEAGGAYDDHDDEHERGHIA
jgi:hypothetical protein